VVKLLILSRLNYNTLKDAFFSYFILEINNSANNNNIKKYIAKTLFISLVAAKDKK
jgi:hypothetical protein